MPTQNPRLTITLEPLLAAQLRRLSDLTGDSQSKIIAELLEGSAPVFARVIQVLEAAKSATAELKGSAAVELDAAQTRVEAQLGLVMESFDDFAGTLLKEAERVGRRAARKKPARPDASASGGAASSGSRGVERVLTPLSNRGVRSVDNSHRGKNGPPHGWTVEEEAAFQAHEKIVLKREQAAKRGGKK